MRKLWTQREVIEMAKLLGFKNFDRRSIGYWSRMGVFPSPVAELRNVLVLYDGEDVEIGLMDISKRMRIPVSIDYSLLKWAKEEVLKSNKAKNVSMMLRKIRE